MRFIDLENSKISEDFFQMRRIGGYPNASNIFSSLMEAFSDMPVVIARPMRRKLHRVLRKYLLRTSTTLPS